MRFKERFKDAEEGIDISTCFLFWERNRLYLVFLSFISILKIVSSYLYLAMCANSMHYWEEEQTVIVLIAVFEGCFVFDMALNFFRKVTPDGQSVPLNSLSKIANHYVSTKFVWHAIPLIPFQYMQISEHRSNIYFLLFKTIRLLDGLACFDVHAIMSFIKRRNIARLQNLI